MLPYLSDCDVGFVLSDAEEKIWLNFSLPVPVDDDNHMQFAGYLSKLSIEVH